METLRGQAILFPALYRWFGLEIIHIFAGRPFYVIIVIRIRRLQLLFDLRVSGYLITLKRGQVII
jgi:hypothetical protein